MGSCKSSELIRNKKSMQIPNISKYPQCKIKIDSPNELKFLSLIYKDLCLRNNSKKFLEKNSFLEFVKLPGLFGERLFDVTDEDKDGYINEEEFLNCVSKYCKSDNETICEEIFKISDTNKDDYIDKKEFFMIFYSLIKDIIDAFAKKKITSEPCILGISKANSLSNLNMTLSTFESCNQNAFRYDVPPEVLIESIFDKFSTSGSQLTYPEFANFIQSQSWILTFIKSTFRIDSWNNQSNMQLKSPLVQPYSNPGIFSIKYSVKIFFHGKWVPKYIEIRDIYIVIYTEKKAIDEVILAEGCLIKTKEQVLSIIYSIQYDERLKIFFSKSEECEFFGNLIVRIANIRKFKNFYSLEQNIGHGKFSEVYIAKEFATNIEWAVKVIHKRKLDKLEREMIRKEISILTYVNHPGIVKIKEVFNSHKYIFIVMDYIPAGNLLKKIKVEKLQECEIRNIVKDILLVLKYLHSLGIMHRDLKPENIMISDSDQIKVIIIDFGLATYFSYDDILSHCCGTLGYTAPEVFAKSYSYKVDIWSVGIIAYACFATKLPFISHFKQETIELTQTKEVTFDDNTWEQCSENSKKLIIDLLAKDPSQRLDCEQALSHPWFEV